MLQALPPNSSRYKHITQTDRRAGNGGSSGEAGRHRASPGEQKPQHATYRRLGTRVRRCDRRCCTDCAADCCSFSHDPARPPTPFQHFRSAQTASSCQAINDRPRCDHAMIPVRSTHASSSSMFLYQPHPRCQQTHVNMMADYGGKWLYPCGDRDPHFHKSAYSIWTLFYPCSALLHCGAYRGWRQPKMSSSASRAFIVSLSVADPDCRLIASSSAVLNPHLGLQDASSIRSAVQPHYSVHTTLGIHTVTVT